MFDSQMHRESSVFDASPPKPLLTPGSFTLAQPQVPPTSARHLTNPSPHHKGGSAGDRSAQAHHHFGKHNSQKLANQQRATGDTQDSLMPSFARHPHLLLESLELRKGLLALGPEPLLETQDEKGGNEHIRLLRSQEWRVG